MERGLATLHRIADECVCVCALCVCVHCVCVCTGVYSMCLGVCVREKDSRWIGLALNAALEASTWNQSMSQRTSPVLHVGQAEQQRAVRGE